MSEYKLRGLEDATKELLDAEDVRVRRVRYETIQDEETGEERRILVPDDLGIDADGLALLVVMMEVDGKPWATMRIFSLDLLEGLSPRELAEFLAPDVQDQIGEVAI